MQSTYLIEPVDLDNVRLPRAAAGAFTRLGVFPETTDFHPEPSHFIGSACTDEQFRDLLVTDFWIINARCRGDGSPGCDDDSYLIERAISSLHTRIRPRTGMLAQHVVETHLGKHDHILRVSVHASSETGPFFDLSTQSERWTQAIFRFLEGVTRSPDDAPRIPHPHI